MEKLIAQNDNEKSELLVNFENSIQSIDSNLSTEIKEFPQIFPIIQQILKQIKVVKQENLKLKNEINLKEGSNLFPINSNAKPSKTSPKIVKIEETSKSLQNVEKIQPTNFREEIQEKISKPNFWNLYKMNVSKNEIFEILKIGTKSCTLKGILFCILKSQK